MNIGLRSKGDPPQSLQQKLRNAFVSNNDVQEDNGLESSEGNVEEKIDHGDDEYIVQFYPSQVEVCNFILVGSYTVQLLNLKLTKIRPLITRSLIPNYPNPFLLLEFNKFIIIMHIT